MSILQEQLNDINIEEKEIHNKIRDFYTLENKLKKSEGFETLIGYCVSFIIVSIFYIYNSNNFIYWHFIYIGLIAIYPSIFTIGVLSPYLKRVYENYTYKKYDTTREEFEGVKTLTGSVRKKRFEVEALINREKEQAFIRTINDTVNNIQNKLIPLEKCIELRDKLKDENIIIRNGGYYWYTRVYYDNRLRKIDEAIQNYHIIPTPTVKPKVTPSINVETVKPKVTEADIKSKSIPVSTPPAPLVQTKAIPIYTNGNPITESLPTISEEKSIDDLFENYKKKEIGEPESQIKREPIKQDFIKVNQRRLEIGALGELYAMGLEKGKLERQGLGKYVEMVHHVSLTDDSLGYDIISVLNDGTPKYIEVKSTTGAYSTEFKITEIEMKAMKELPNYFIYRIFNLDTEDGKGQSFCIDCKKDIHKFYNLEPASYKVTPKGK